MQDIGFQLENIVYMELRRRGYDVSVGALLTGEIDFVAQKHSERMYIQVCESILDEATRQREGAPLNAVGDSYPKLILTRDTAAEGLLIRAFAYGIFRSGCSKENHDKSRPGEFHRSRRDGPQRLRDYDYLLRHCEGGRWMQAG